MANPSEDQDIPRDEGDADEEAEEQKEEEKLELSAMAWREHVDL